MDVTVPCPCEGTPHPDGDTVTLRDKPPLRMGMTALAWASAQAENESPTSGDIAELFIRDGVSDWTFLLDDGSPRPVDAENMDWFLEDYTLAFPVAEEASGLYTDVIFRPLVERLNKSTPTKARRRSSQRSQTASSTSAT